MPNPFPPLLVLAIGAIVLVAMWRLGALLPPSVTAWNRIGKHYGMIDGRPLTERLGDRALFMRKIDELANIPRLLAIADRQQSAASWALGTVALALAIVLTGVIFDLLSLALSGTVPLPMVDWLIFAAAAAGIRYLLLRLAAKQRQQAIQTGLSDALTEIAILTYTKQMPIDQAVEFVARAQCDGRLWGLLKDDNWKRLARVEHQRPGGRGRGNVSAAAVYERIGLAYQIPIFSLLGGNMRRVADKGLEPRRVLTNLARSVGTSRLVEMERQSERSRFRQAIPLGLMLLPLLLVIGFPTFSALMGAFP